MDMQFKAGDRVAFKWIVKNFWKARGSKEKSQPHASEKVLYGTFLEYHGTKMALILLDGREGGAPIKKPVKLKYLTHAEQEATA
jgi:hypothetical protein